MDMNNLNPLDPTEAPILSLATSIMRARRLLRTMPAEQRHSPRHLWSIAPALVSEDATTMRLSAEEIEGLAQGTIKGQAAYATLAIAVLTREGLLPALSA